MSRSPTDQLPAVTERLELVPITFAEAAALVEQEHRHHRAPVSHKFSLAAALKGEIVGVAIVGRPVARNLDDGWTLEVTRLCTMGTPNACSFLYARAWKCAKALGYRRLVTYILSEEPGTTLKAAGWRCVGEAGGGKWGRTGRPRVDKHPTQTKIRWEAV